MMEHVFFVLIMRNRERKYNFNFENNNLERKFIVIYIQVITNKNNDGTKQVTLIS